MTDALRNAIRAAVLRALDLCQSTEERLSAAVGVGAGRRVQHDGRRWQIVETEGDAILLLLRLDGDDIEADHSPHRVMRWGSVVVVEDFAPDSRGRSLVLRADREDTTGSLMKRWLEQIGDAGSEP